eukprot:scaffold1670_cov370-Prasinococcus_capsulatus_cf.AAC.3
MAYNLYCLLMRRKPASPGLVPWGGGHRDTGEHGTRPGRVAQSNRRGFAAAACALTAVDLSARPAIAPPSDNDCSGSGARVNAHLSIGQCARALSANLGLFGSRPLPSCLSDSSERGGQRVA